MAEHVTPCAAPPVSCGVEAVWYVEQRLLGAAASRETLVQAFPNTEGGGNLHLLQLKQYLEGGRGLWTAGVKTSLWRLDQQFDDLLCIAHCEGPRAPGGHLIALEKDGSDYVLGDMGKVVRLPGLAGERKLLEQLEARLEMTGTVLLAAREPMPLPRAHYVPVMGGYCWPYFSWRECFGAAVCVSGNGTCRCPRRLPRSGPYPNAVYRNNNVDAASVPRYKAV